MAPAKKKLGPTFAEAIKPYQPPPGIIPSGEMLAMDYDAVASGFAPALGGVDVGSMSAFGGGFIGYMQLAGLAQMPEFQMFARVISNEMTRAGIELRSKSKANKADKIAEITEAVKMFKVVSTIKEAIYQDVLFGVSHVLVDCGEGANASATPMTIADGGSIGRGELKAFRVIDPYYCYGRCSNTSRPAEADFLMPDQWFVLGVPFHASRMLTFCMRPAPTVFRAAYNYGGMAISQLMYSYVFNFIRLRDSIADLVNACSIITLATTLDDQAADVEVGNRLIGRINEFQDTKNNAAVLIYDKMTEQVDILQTSLAGMHEIEAQHLEHFCTFLNIPIVILLGDQPTGLNASSEGQLQAWYNTNQAEKEVHVIPHATTMINAIQLHLYGSIDPDIIVTMPSPWQMDPKESIDIEKTKTEIFQTLIAAGIISEEEARECLSNDEKSQLHGTNLTGPPPPKPMLDPKEEADAAASTDKADAEDKEGEGEEAAA